MKKQWWHNKVVYQIYPKSFYDSDGDGIGDIPGIIAKLDYLKDLGVDILWLSPVYASPLADQGYDISDYYRIDPRFGTMEDMDDLIRQAKERGMYILMDLVVNHCSDEHEWFREACRDPEGEYGGFFYLADRQPDGKLPCNWRSYFGGPVWEELPGHPDKLYLHVFHKKQPDLNWENEKVRREIYRNINWWLDKGLGGFRVDAIMNIKKKLPFADYPADRADGLSDIGQMLHEAEGIGTFLGEMQRETFGPHHAFSVGEVFNNDPATLRDFIGEGGYFSSIFDFSANVYGKSEKGWYDNRRITPEAYKHCCFEAQRMAEGVGFFSNIIENHDEPRGVSYYIPHGECSERSKKMLAALYFLLKGIPFIYQGQEIGMENINGVKYEEIDDISARNEYQVALKAGRTPEEAMRAVGLYSRDNARTPVQWSTAEHAGFTAGSPWLRVNPNYREINVEDQQKKEGSVLRFYQKLIALRKDPEYEETLVYGRTIPFLEEQVNLMAYHRKGEKDVLVLGNFQMEAQTVRLPGAYRKILLNNLEGLREQDGTLLLEGYQAVVLEME